MITEMLVGLIELRRTRGQCASRASDYGGSPIPVESLDRAMGRLLPPQQAKIACRGPGGENATDRIGSALHQLENRYKAVHHAVRPPSTGIATPLMNEASSLAR